MSFVRHVRFYICIDSSIVYLPQLTILSCSKAGCTLNPKICAGSASFFLRSKRHLAELSTRPDLPKLLILGNRDQFSSLTSMQKVFEPHKQKAGWQDTPNSELDHTVIETMVDCDHFFANQRSELAKRVLSFCINAHEETTRNHEQSKLSDRSCS